MTEFLWQLELTAREMPTLFTVLCAVLGILIVVVVEAIVSAVRGSITWYQARQKRLRYEAFKAKYRVRPGWEWDANRMGWVCHKTGRFETEDQWIDQVDSKAAE